VEKLTWLQNLQKAEMPPAPVPAPAPEKIDMFSDLFRVDGDVAVAKAASPFENGASNVPDGVTTFLEANQRERFRIGKPFPDEPEPDNLYAFHETPVQGFVEEKIAKLLGLADISDEMPLAK